MNLEQKQREEARWRILRVLDAGRPIAVSETIVWRVLADIKLAITLNALRRELTYLRDRDSSCRNLVRPASRSRQRWHVPTGPRTPPNRGTQLATGCSGRDRP